MNIKEKHEKRRNKLKFTIQGFNQIEAIKMGLSTDDLTILRWFIDYQSTNAMERSYIENANEMGFWVDYGTLIDGLPILLADGNLYLERFIELEKLFREGKFQEYKIKKKKYHDTNRKKVQRILAGPLSKILVKDDMKVLGNERGSKVFVYINRENYSKLLLSTNIEVYLLENGVDIKAVNEVGDKSVSPVGDKSVSPVGDKSVSPDSSINHSSIIDSSINDSSINKKEDLSIFLKLSTKQKKHFLKSKFKITEETILNIILVVDISIEEGSIKAKQHSNSYWVYIYKMCQSKKNERYEEKSII